MAIQKYCCTFYGTNLHDLRNKQSQMIYASWRTSLKLTWNLTRNCKNFFLPHLAPPNVTPPQIQLLSRFHKFFHSLLDSPSKEIQIVAQLSARNLRSILGRNLSLVSRRGLFGEPLENEHTSDVRIWNT